MLIQMLMEMDSNTEGDPETRNKRKNHERTRIECESDSLTVISPSLSLSLPGVCDSHIPVSVYLFLLLWLHHIHADLVLKRQEGEIESLIQDTRKRETYSLLPAAGVERRRIGRERERE